MEYKNNWPTYLQEKKSPAKGLFEGNSSGICVGKANKQQICFGLQSLAEAEVKKKRLVENSKLTIDVILRQLIGFQKSADLTFSCRARKATLELVKERKRLSNLVNRLMHKAHSGLIALDKAKKIIASENKIAISTFLTRWANLFEVV